MSRNIHASAIVTGETGLLIIGPPASGKSHLARQCLLDARSRGRFAALVSDDRVIVEEAGQRLIASSPPEIAGLIEIRGSGIIGVDYMPQAVMHVAIRAVDAEDSERLPERQFFEPLPGVNLPLLYMVADRMIGPLDLVEAFLDNRLIRS
ncbi:MAG: HPr kinase [Rhizobiaceae bacterium MnEN-MB40S]|nr:MAG: HPr kinase [Rhizobiaceae bacterium MnEN-MB40S]